MYLFVSGVSRISTIIRRMLGKEPNLFFRLTWMVATPLLVLVSHLLANLPSFLSLQLLKIYTRLDHILNIDSALM